AAGDRHTLRAVRREAHGRLDLRRVRPGVVGRPADGGRVPASGGLAGRRGRGPDGEAPRHRRPYARDDARGDAALRRALSHGTGRAAAMMVGAALVGWAIGFGLAAATRTETGPALYVPLPAALRRFFER